MLAIQVSAASVRIPPVSDDDRINQITQSDQSVLTRPGRIPPASEASGRVHASMRPSGAGLRWSGNCDIGYLDADTGNPVERSEAQRRIRDRVGLVWESGEYFDLRGNRVSWDAAHERISGRKAGNAA